MNINGNGNHGAMPTNGAPSDERATLIRGADGRLYSVNPEARGPSVVSEIASRSDPSDLVVYSVPDHALWGIANAEDISGSGGSLPTGTRR